MISCALSPNTETDDVFLALRVLFMPWKWKRGSAVGKVEQRLGGVSFNSGRAALLAILRTLNIGRGDEVIVQAFTCVAVPNSVRWAGATPVFADIGDQYTMDPQDFEKKITPHTKAVIVQHTFGIPADMDRILPIAKMHHLKVIEDFAHTMSLPLRGDAGFYSFGRDKVLSSVFGGLAVGVDVKKYHKKLEYPSYFWIFQQLLHPIAFSTILPLYQLGIGKVLLVILQRLHLLSFPVYPEEKKGRQPSVFPAKYPNALAMLLVNQLKKLDRYSRIRETAVSAYGGKGPLLRYPKIVDDPALVLAKARKKGILLGNWYHNVVDPTDPQYRTGSCPKAEEAARGIINLPTRVSVADAARVLKAL